MANITMHIDNLRILTAPITDWRAIQSRPLNEEERSWYGSHIQNGSGVHCGGVVLLQCVAGERVQGHFSCGSLPGDVVVETDHVIRGMAPIVWQWRPDGARNDAGIHTPAEPPATSGTLEVR